MDRDTPFSSPQNRDSDSSWDAVILHVDMDAFFLSVELLDFPQFRGVPAVTAKDSPRSVVTSASYEARSFGVRSAMPLAHAKALCPHLVVLEPHREKYTRASAVVMEVLHSITPVVEKLSIDEAFLDVSGARRRLGSPAQIGALIRQRIREVTGLPATVGAAANKTVAKIVSTRSKPDGLGVVPADQTRQYLAPLPVNMMWGVGPKLLERFNHADIHTIGDLAQQDPARMQRWIGISGPQLVELAQGVDPRPVITDQESKSIGVEKTFDEDVVRPVDLDKALLELSYECARRMRAENFVAPAISVKLKDDQRKNRTKTITLDRPTDSGRVIHQAARPLVQELLGQRWHPVRLLGVRGERVHEPEAEPDSEQDALFDIDVEDSAGESISEERQAQLQKTDRVMDQIRSKYPSAVIRPARLLDEK